MCRSFGAPLAGLLLIGLVLGRPSVAAAQADPAELKRLSIEDLMGIDVVVSRLPGGTLETPAAVHVITHDDIRRSGATSVGEALRLAPGVHVARIDTARFAIGIRGFSDRLARSMLVMIDGRAVYSPLFAGTYWETQFPMLDLIDRIEVVRGPGGTLWGANAVNGIINIVTRSARETQELRVTGRLGHRLRGPIGVSLGDTPGANVAYRAYVQAVAREAFSPSGSDDFRIVQGGVRSDWNLGATRRLTLQGDAYLARLDQGFSLPLETPPFADTGIREAPLSGANVLARFRSSPTPGTTLQVQSYYDRTSRSEVPVGETRDTFDVDVQMTRRLGTRHHLAWGAGYRLSSGRIEAVAPVDFTPARRTDHLVTGFVEDRIELVPGRLRATIGTKIEHNDYTGVELQPSARLLVRLTPLHALMGAVSRALRTPSRIETDYTLLSLADPATPAFIRLLPNPDFTTEKYTVWELGYRARPHASLYVTAAGFFNDLDDVLSTELAQPPFVEPAQVPRLIFPVTFRNGLHGNAYGGELTLDWRPRPWWRWTADYGYVRIQLTPDEGAIDVSQERRNERLTPRHVFGLQSSIDLPHGLQFDWGFRRVSAIRVGDLPGYATSDLRLSWLVTPALELAIVGQDLHEDRHVEWPEASQPVPRRAFVSVTWRD